MQIHGAFAQNVDSVGLGYGLEICILNKYFRSSKNHTLKCHPRWNSDPLKLVCWLSPVCAMHFWPVNPFSGYFCLRKIQIIWIPRLLPLRWRLFLSLRWSVRMCVFNTFPDEWGMVSIHWIRISMHHLMLCLDMLGGEEKQYITVLVNCHCYPDMRSWINFNTCFWETTMFWAPSIVMHFL